MDQIVSTNSSAAEDDESAKKEEWFLTRVGKKLERLCLYENTQVTLGRGLNVTHQLLSQSNPLMISRLHCMFKRGEDGQWTVTDMKSLNGVWVNEQRIPVDKAHSLKPGDSIKLGVPVVAGTEVEYEYILVKRRLIASESCLASGANEAACLASRSKKTKRKLNSDELEPSASSKSKLYRCSPTDKSHGQPCPTDEPREKPGSRMPEEAGPSALQRQEWPSGDLSSLQIYSQNIQVLHDRLGDTQRLMEVVEGQRQHDPHREEQVKELQSQLELLHGQLRRMEMLEKSIGETQKRLELQKTFKQQSDEEALTKQLKEALLEQRKVIEELALSRQGFEDVIKAKDKELEVTKEEKERARAQKEEVVTQITEVLENELQCIICSELFIEAVTVNCTHSFCLHCIREWLKRKDECPICRQAILSQTRSLVLDNCIDRMVEQLSLDMKLRRQELIVQRKGESSA
ncbi:E3 ubiquitin-protein ligase rnf8 isoform X2 [Esox lucius]|uniref:E3 ubiquitin-protein ligase rnf8 isoform X2 n=1 Tax=Esox lucius TaxID=8010 RepID=UPI00057768EA|nr:E3 ubiquitin-protein ligase rnf8 isoform X2 [Esox lucius]